MWGGAVMLVTQVAHLYPVSSALVTEDSTVVMGKGGYAYTSGPLSLLGTEVQTGGAGQTSTWTSGTERPSQHSLWEDRITAEPLSNLCPSPPSLHGGATQARDSPGPCGRATASHGGWPCVPFLGIFGGRRVQVR